MRGMGRPVGFWSFIICSNSSTTSNYSITCYVGLCYNGEQLQYIPRNMHTVFALLCFVVVIHWLIFPYPSGLLHWHCGNLTIAPVPAKQPWWIWINTSCEFIVNDCITTTKQSTTKPCAYFLGYTVYCNSRYQRIKDMNRQKYSDNQNPCYGRYVLRIHTSTMDRIMFVLHF